MARVIIRRNPKPIVFGNDTVAGHATETIAGIGTVEQIGDTITGQSVNDDRITTEDDNATGAGQSGNTPNFVNPTSGTGTDSGTDTGRKRRRRSDAGTRRGTRTSNGTETTKDITSLLLTVHFGLAGMLHVPKLKLTEVEAQTLSAAITRVTDLYDVRIIPEKQMAWLNLVITAGCIYVPRMRKDKITGTEKVSGPGTGNVVSMPSVQGDATKVM